MKIFIYKSLIIFFLVIIGFQLTFTYAQKSIKREIDNLGSKENIDLIKDKIRSQIKDAIKKEDLIKSEDVALINQFLEKIQRELKEDK